MLDFLYIIFFFFFSYFFLRKKRTQERQERILSRLEKTLNSIDNFLRKNEKSSEESEEEEEIESEVEIEENKTPNIDFANMFSQLAKTMYSQGKSEEDNGEEDLFSGVLEEISKKMGTFANDISTQKYASSKYQDMLMNNISTLMRGENTSKNIPEMVLGNISTLMEGNNEEDDGEESLNRYIKEMSE